MVTYRSSSFDAFKAHQKSITDQNDKQVAIKNANLFALKLFKTNNDGKINVEDGAPKFNWWYVILNIGKVMAFLATLIEFINEEIGNS